MITLILITLILRFLGVTADETFGSPYHYYCEKGLCKKAEITENVKTPLPLSVCQLLCGEVGSIWPKPTGQVTLSNSTFDLNADHINLSGIDLQSYVGQLIKENVDGLKRNVKKLAGSKQNVGKYNLTIKVSGQFDVTKAKLTLETPENYNLKIYSDGNQQLIAEVNSESYFGIRNGLETLSQLIVYDDIYENVKIISEAQISDAPVFPYRGLLLDTSRNFIDKACILRTIEAMGMSKLNTFHWHITDSHSFPYVSRTLPKMSKYGAYAPDKIYSEDDVKEIVRFGLLKGVRVLPEFDAPAHVGEGWQWVGDDAILCFNVKPYMPYCTEPPCGQLNPTSGKVYEILESIYSDMLQDFDPDFFHMGGDEVNLRCWKSSKAIKNWMSMKGWDNSSDSSFYKLWDYFQAKAYDTLTKANKDKEVKAVLWTSALTNEENLKYLDPKKYIIQIWTDANDDTISRLIKNNFTVIFSNYDALYLDCGFSAWIGSASNNWCSPYKGWQKIYGNSPMNILKKQGFNEEYKHLVLGGEAALWSEQVDSTSVDSRLWPRAAALAERLWSDPSTQWSKAEQRMLRHRERLVQKGIFADSLEPEWCWQNQGGCTRSYRFDDEEEL